MFKAVIFTLCTGFSFVKTCSLITPTIYINNNICKYETAEIIAYSYGDERCEINKHSGTYTYTTRGFPPSTHQDHFQKRFEALKQKFEDKK